MSTIFDYSSVKGINNVDTSFRLISKGSVELLEAVNVDITDRGTIKRRPSGSILYSGTGAIANFKGIGEYVYFTEGFTVKRINSSGGVEVFESFSSLPSTVTFAKCGDVVYASNNVEIIRLDGETEENTLPNLSPLPAGAIFHFAGKLFSIVNKYVYFSEPFNYLYYIPEKNYLLFPEEIIAYEVNDFVCLSTTVDVRIIGKDFSTDVVLDVPAFPNSMVSVKAFRVGGQVVPHGIIFESSQGFFLATPQGCTPLNDRYARTYPAYSKAAGNNSRTIILTNG